MNVRNIVKDRNKDSSDSTLKVNYIVDFSNRNTPRCIKLNPILLKHLENHEIIKIKSDKFKLFELFYYRKNGMILKVMNKEFQYTEKTSKFIFFQS